MTSDTTNHEKRGHWRLWSFQDLQDEKAWLEDLIHKHETDLEDIEAEIARRSPGGEVWKKSDETKVDTE